MTTPRPTSARACAIAACALAALLPTAVHAAEIDGAALSPWWGVPFAGLLLSIALMPLLLTHLWHHHYGKVTMAWAAAFLVPFAVIYGPAAATSA